MEQGVGRHRRGCAGIVGFDLAERRLARRRRSRSQHHGRLEVDLAFGLGEPGELKAALKELVRRWSGQGECASVPALQLREAPTRPDLSLKHAKVALGEDDPSLDVLERGSLRGHVERDKIAAKRRTGAAGDHEDGAEAAATHCRRSLRGGTEVRTALRRRAERARGLAASSCSAGDTGLATRSNVGWFGSTNAGRWRDPAGVPPLRSRKKRFTIRSSRLWKVTTAKRPPGHSERSAAANPSSSSSSSALRWIRTAWKVRVAGSAFWPGRKPAARRTMAASSAVRSTGRAATMARAIARARGSSP